ncbi:MAG: TIGR01906 family membrane protein [Clostridiales bacterium]|nr:TIGR01906 family membrane protein [Clostridiales bacterium]
MRSSEKRFIQFCLVNMKLEGMCMKKRLGFALCLLGTAAMILWGVLWSVENFGTDPFLYKKLQFEARPDILEYAGISEDDLVRVNEALADCLQGDPDVLENLEAEVFGKVQPAFNERELVHMEDCRKLFELARTVRNIAVVFGPLALILGVILLNDRRKARISVLLGPVVLAAPLGLLAAWAAVDFNAAFNFFHRILFTNDLWLLDPHTDLLIRICPQKMFMEMGRYIGVVSIKTGLSILTAALIAVWTFSILIAKDGDVK